MMYYEQAETIKSEHKNNISVTIEDCKCFLGYQFYFVRIHKMIKSPRHSNREILIKNLFIPLLSVCVMWNLWRNTNL